VGKSVPRAALLQFVDDGQEVVVGREKAAELNVVGTEPGKLRLLIDTLVGVKADEVKECEQGMGHTPPRAADRFFKSTDVGNQAHQKTPTSLFYLCWIFWRKNLRSCRALFFRKAQIWKGGEAAGAGCSTSAQRVGTSKACRAPAMPRRKSAVPVT